MEYLGEICLLVGIVFMLATVFLGLDELILGLPWIMVGGSSVFTYGAMSFTDFSTTVNIGSSVVAGLAISCLYKQVTSITTTNLN